MPRYSIMVSERYDDDDDDEQPRALHRVGGPVVGLSTGDWPRWGGRPMQHAFTIDLAELELDVPRAAEARALALFVDSYYELDVDSRAGVTVVWLSQAQIDAHPETAPPPDFVAEKVPNREQMDETGEVWATGEPELEFERIEDDEGDFGESTLGGEPRWRDDEAPDELPEGAFVMQVMSWEFPFCRVNSCLFVFEGGGYVQAEDDDDERRPPPWPEAIAASRELVVLDEAPAPDALQKWGGIPRGVDSYSWPRNMSHIVTWVPESLPEHVEAVALALFGRLSKTSNWDDELSFYQVLEITQDDLDEYDPAQFELPEGATVLDERAIELRELPEGTTWHDLQTRNFVGPRPAWRDPGRRSAYDEFNGAALQLTDELLPVSPGAGTLHATTEGYPIWHPAPGAPQVETERYEPDGTLYDSETTAAIVVGWQLNFEAFSVLPERVEALERNLLSILAARDLDLRLYVPGDTTTDRDGEVHGSFVLGRAVAVCEANDPDPTPFTLDDIARARAALPELDDAFWREALAFTEGMQPPDEPDAYLLSWGPLCYGAIYVGLAAGPDDEHTYKFVANQDMNQEWSSAGIDGVFVEGADFSSVVTTTLTAETLGKAKKLDNPGFWLICRYD